MMLQVGAHQHHCPLLHVVQQGFDTGGNTGAVWTEPWEASMARSGVSRVGVEAWASWVRGRVPKGRAAAPQACPAAGSPSHPVQGHGPCQRGWAVPGASCHSRRSSNTIAASPVSSLPLLLPVFLGAERWDAPSWRAGSQPLSPSFCLSPTHSSPLQQPAQGQGGQGESRPRW